MSKRFKQEQSSLDKDERDIEERDKFAKRLLEKDISKTKNQNTKDISNAIDEQVGLEVLRERSRQIYLEKREQQQVQLLKLGVQDEEFLFKDEPLTDLEIIELQRKKELLSIVEEKQLLDQQSKSELYHMPENYFDEKKRIEQEKEKHNIYSRYMKQDNVALNDVWEQEQIQKGIISQQKEEDLEFVYDQSQIEFVASCTLEGDQPPAPTIKDIWKKREQEIQQSRESLPIFQYREELLNSISEYQILIIVGETGSGKTTQIPQYLYESGYTAGNESNNKMIIGCTQPRRVAAMSVASRVSQEMNTKLGNQVGYSIRFEDCTSDKTIIKYMTDGMLLREFLLEPDLGRYSVIILDEAHERTLHTEILFGLVKDIARFRPELKVLISSATLDAERFSAYFDNAPIFHIPGRRYPVDIYYTVAPEADYLSASITTVLQIHTTQPLPGDILVFLTGQEEIETAMDSLSFIIKKFGSKMKELLLCPIYSTLPSEMQAEIFKPTPNTARKVILATNIAETSITIDGITYVIDPGFVKQNVYNPRTGIESLVIVPCSKASANQRAGRAGRVGPGKCFRLYTQWAYDHDLDENPIPEIQRTNLSNVVLMLKSLGIHDLIHFDFMDPPSPDALIRSLELLYALGALNKSGQLTMLGRKMAEFPMDPMMSKMLIQSEKYQCSDEIVTICAMLSVQNSIFYRPKDKRAHVDQVRQTFNRPEGDHLTLLYIWNQWKENDFRSDWCFENFIQVKSMKRSRDVREQLVSLMERVEVPLLCNDDPNAINKAIASGYFYHASRMTKTGEGYQSVKHYKDNSIRQTMHIHPTSSLFKIELPPKWIIYHELVLTTKEYMRQVTEIRPEWLLEIAPHYYQENELDLNRKQNRH